MDIRCVGITILAITISGCTVVGYKKGDTMVLKGFGAKKATWGEMSIEKQEPFKVPDILPNK